MPAPGKMQNTTELRAEVNAERCYPSTEAGDRDHRSKNRTKGRLSFPVTCAVALCEVDELKRSRFRVEDLHEFAKMCVDL